MSNFDFNNANNFFMRSNHLSTILDSISLKSLFKYIPPIYPDINCLEVLKKFTNDSKLFLLPLINEENIPIGIITRNNMLNFFSRMYAKELNNKKFIKELIGTSVVNTSSIILEQEKSIDDVVRIILDKRQEDIMDGFIITCEGVYVGMSSGYDLLNSITEQKNNYLYQLSHFDYLTGLPSRLLFEDRLLQSCARIIRKNKEKLNIHVMMALLFLDLDRFKLVNDTFGHHMGDILLKEVSKRLLSCVRTEDTVARLGGDEFTIILNRIKNTQDVAYISNKILDALNKPFILCEQEVFIGVSIGIALYPVDDSDINNLIKKSDTALYHAKENGKNQYQFFTKKMNAVILKRISMEKDLRIALENNEFYLVYQPQVDIKTGMINGLETLIRWKCKGNEISPMDFIPFAEETDLIIYIGDWVLRTACEQAKQWQIEGIPPIQIAINVSMKQLRQKNFVQNVIKIVEETGFDFQWLEFELTESLLIKNIDDTIIILEQIKKLGITISIDDFGTGYSSLSYLQRLPIDTLKIDQSFVQKINIEGTNLNIIRAIIGLAHGLGINVIAEGVETNDQLKFLSDQKCDQAQGYLYSKPLLPEKIKEFLKQNIV